MYKITLDQTTVEAAFSIILNKGSKAGITDDGFLYKVRKSLYSEEYVEIIDYKGNESNLTVPATIEGYSVKKIGDWAFEHKEFRTLIISEGIEEMVNGTLYNCENLEELYIPSTMNIISCVFTGCKNLKSIIVDDNSEYLYVKDNYLLTKSDELLYAFGEEKKTIVIDNYIKEISGYALNDTGVEILYLPYSIKVVFQSARTIKEMHFKNPNTRISYAGIPSSGYDAENSKYTYTVKVYAPAGGNVEKYCMENDVPFEAEGEPCSAYSVVFIESEHTQEKQSYEVDKGEALGIRVFPDSAYKEYTYEGYTFEGWYIKGEERLYQPEELISYIPDKDVTFIAKWSKNIQEMTPTPTVSAAPTYTVAPTTAPTYTVAPATAPTVTPVPIDVTPTLAPVASTVQPVLSPSVSENTITETSVKTSAQDRITISSLTCKKNTKKITGKVSVKGATVRIKVGRKAYKKAKVKGKTFTLKLNYRLKKNTRIIINVSKSNYAGLKKTYKVK